MPNQNGSSGSNSGPADPPRKTEAYEALKGALKEEVYGPVENDLQQTKETVENALNSHSDLLERRIESLKEGHSKDIADLQDFLQEGFDAVEKSYENLRGRVSDLESSADEARSLLETEDGTSQLEAFSSTLGDQSERIEKHSRLISDLEESQKVLSTSIDATDQSVRKLASDVQDLGQQIEDAISAVQQVQSRLENHAERTNQELEAAARNRRLFFISLGTGMAMVAIALGVSIYLGL